MPDFAQLGMQAASQVIDAGIGLALQKGQDKRQMNMQRKLQRMQMEGTKEMTDYNWNKQLEMWKATNYSAQKEELKKAGLNPGLLYGMSGGGGVTADVKPGDVSGGQAPRGGGEIQSMIGMGIQRQQLQLQQEMQKAQIANLNANTEKTRVEATKTAGVDTQEATSRIGEIAARTQNIKAQQALTEVQARIQKVSANIAESTEQEQIDQINAELQQTYANVEKQQLANGITKATADEVIAAAAADLYLTYAQTKLAKSNVAKNDQEIKLMKEQVRGIIAGIVQRDMEIDVSKDQAAAATQNAETQRRLMEFETSFGKQAGDIIRSVIPNVKIPTKRPPVGYGRK